MCTFFKSFSGQYTINFFQVFLGTWDTHMVEVLSRSEDNLTFYSFDGYSVQIFHLGPRPASLAQCFPK